MHETVRENQRAAHSAPQRHEENSVLHLHLGGAHLQPIVALAAGVLILARPRLLNYIVAAYLILSGLIGLGFLR